MKRMLAIYHSSLCVRYSVRTLDSVEVDVKSATAADRQGSKGYRRFAEQTRSGEQLHCGLLSHRATSPATCWAAEARTCLIDETLQAYMQTDASQRRLYRSFSAPCLGDKQELTVCQSIESCLELRLHVIIVRGTSCQFRRNLYNCCFLTEIAEVHRMYYHM